MEIISKDSAAILFEEGFIPQISEYKYVYPLDKDGKVIYKLSHVQLLPTSSVAPPVEGISAFAYDEIIEHLESKGISVNVKNDEITLIDTEGLISFKPNIPTSRVEMLVSSIIDYYYLRNKN